MSLTTKFAHRMRERVQAAMPPARVHSPRAGITRKDFTDPLGLPGDATDAQILTAIDDKLAARDARTASEHSARQSDLYKKAWG